MREFTGFKKGLDLGGWLSQCGNDYTENRYMNYITEDDFKEIAGWVEKMTPECDCVFPLPANEMREASLKIFGPDFDGEFAALGDKMLDATYFKNMFAQAVEVAEKYDVPLYCGEYGVIDQADPQSTVAWYKAINEALEDCNIARAAWTYKEMDFGITQPHLAGVKDEIIKLL